MTVDEYRFVVHEIRPYTDYVYLHVLGEPFLHPHFAEILLISKEIGLNVNISTNGSLLQKRSEILLKNPVRQINISLHDAEENIPREDWTEFILNILDISLELSVSTYINFRLWNQTNSSSEDFNALCLSLIKDRFQLTESADLFIQNGRNIKLAHNIYLQLAPRFEWVKDELNPNKNCYGLRDQIAILSDGSVVPCCIDADANLLLGNIFTEKLSAILSTERARRIKSGFEQHKAIESYCQSCGFRAD
jgi:radical SAM protein with 4Fe4S-binding SPASM domain